MSRLTDQPIEVSGPLLQPSGMPRQFKWRGQWFLVRDLLDMWTDTGSWWDGEAEATFFRLAVNEGTIVEIMRDSRGNWRLYRVYD